MSDEEGKPQSKVAWPDGAELKIDGKHLLQMRAALEKQFKHIVYNQPEFNTFRSMGKTNFFQHFRTPDGIDFGVCHLYWDENADDGIDHVDEDGNIIPKNGGWCIKWHTKAEFDKLSNKESIISTEGMETIHNAFAEKLRTTALENLKQFQEDQEDREQLEDWLSEEPPKFLN